MVIPCGQKAYDLSWHEAAFDIFQTNDSGFIITGIVQNLSTFQYNLSLIKTDSNGDTLWTKLFMAVHLPAKDVQFFKQMMEGMLLWVP